MTLKLYKGSLIAVLLAIAVVYNFQTVKFKSVTQYNFESWLSTLNNQSPESLDQEIESVTIEGRFNNILFSLKSTTPSDTDSITRILDLLKEADIFSLPSDKSLSGDEIFVKSRNNSFATSISKDEASKDHKIQLLFKLLQLKGEQIQSSAFARRNNGESVHE